MENKYEAIETTDAETEIETEREYAEESGRIHSGILHKLYIACHFIPLISTLAIALGFWGNLPAVVQDYILVPIVIIGWIAALCTGPLKFIQTFLGFIIGGWSLGYNLCRYFPLCLATGLLTAAFGGLLGLCVVLFAPAVFTIISFCNKFVL